jgi:uncharacterized protein (UPF0335 family)
MKNDVEKLRSIVRKIECIRHSLDKIKTDERKLHKEKIGLISFNERLCRYIIKLRLKEINKQTFVDPYGFLTDNDGTRIQDNKGNYIKVRIK